MLIDLWWNFYKTHREPVNYLVVGGMTTAISLATYFICVTTILSFDDPVELQIANILSWIVAVTFAYFANRFFVFQSHAANIVREAFSFYVSRIGTLLMDIAIMHVTVIVLHWNDKLAKLFVQVVVVIANYVTGKFWVFRKADSGKAHE